MDINSLNTMYSDYLQKTNSDTSNKISRLSEDSLKNASDEELMEACKQFEAYFIEQPGRFLTFTRVP